MVLEVFGNILYYPPDTDHLKEFPSPQELKGRVLLSTKPPKEYLETKVGDTIKDGDPDLHLGKGAGDDAAWGKEVPDFQTEIQSAKQVAFNTCYISTNPFLQHMQSISSGDFIGTILVPYGSTTMMPQDTKKTTTTKTKKKKNRKCSHI